MLVHQTAARRVANSFSPQNLTYVGLYVLLHASCAAPGTYLFLHLSVRQCLSLHETAGRQLL